ncbi:MULTISPECIES: PH-like domain-containing protein [unclassified Streptomyces]|uniref:PH-like domain-containing protein n=1 Tax=unclassified Streptomyces TaxID=2593676 RepID=UPI00203342A0|nr:MULTISPECIES: hypothetical protein [unclassified Streptomyces]MCM2418263.1 hypothetical protein [Streptomyces sp. RKAG293]MCM2429571.1 hypothetical protein [Streptomyces sp. RKAG337]
MTTLTLLLAADQKSQQVTDWSARIGWIVGLGLFVALVYWLMREGWKWRGTLQGGLPELPTVPEDGAEPLLTLRGRYHGSTTAGQWLDRIVAHGLGVRSMAVLTLTEQGLHAERTGAPDFFVPTAALRGARLDKGIAGKVLTEGGLLVITWEHGGRLIDSGFRSEHAAEHAGWVDAVGSMASASGAAASAAGAPVPDQHPGDSAVAAPLHQEGPR